MALGLAALAAGPGLAGETTPPRVTYIVGPVPIAPSGDLIIHAILGRLTALGLDPSVRQVGTALEFTVTAPDDPDRLGPALTQPGRLSLHGGVEDAPDCATTPAGTTCLPDLDGKASYRMAATPAIAGERLSGAEAVEDPSGGGALLLAFDAAGAAALSELTAEMIGQRLAVVVDDVVFTAPVIRDRIAGGKAMISGAGLDARLWAAILSQPALPEPLAIYEIKEAPAQ